MIWAACAAGAALITRNPWYLLLTGWAAWLVRRRQGPRRPDNAALRWVVPLLIFPAGLNLLFSRAGETVLLKLPIPWIGGPYTFEAFLFGVTAGVQIASLLIVMLVFSEAVAPADLLRRTPPGLYPAGITASIAMTFVPRARRAFGNLREAQQVRGYQPHGWRDLPGLVTPLVVLSLESALSLAEGLVARGWGREGLTDGRRRLASLGWVSLAAGAILWAALPGANRLALGLTLVGSAALGIWLRTGHRANRYSPEVWRRSDSVVAGLSLGVLALFAFLVLNAPLSLTYLPYPRATWPSFQWPLGLAVLLLSAPAWIRTHD